MRELLVITLVPITFWNQNVKKYYLSAKLIL
jgi:hypothetical protein